MSFDWDRYDTGGDYISAAEKAVLAETGAPFNVCGVVERDGKFESDREFAIKIVVPDHIPGVAPGERVMTFAKGSGADSRDAMLTGMIAYFDGPGADEIPAKLTKVGRAWLVKPA